MTISSYSEWVELQIKDLNSAIEAYHAVSDEIGKKKAQDAISAILFRVYQ